MPSKLKPHCIGGTSDGKALALMGNGAKLVDDFGMVNELPGDALVIGRRILVYPDQNGRVVTVENLLQAHDPVSAAVVWMDLMLPVIRANPRIKIWEILNEPVLGDDPSGYIWLSNFSIACMQLLESVKDASGNLLGLKGVIYNFSAGNPSDWSFWPVLLSAIRYARDNGHYLGLHEYGAIWMWWMTGNFQISVPQDAWSTSLASVGYTTLRYRTVYDQFLKPARLGDTQLLITEAGLDAVGPAPQGFNAGNWRFSAGQWGQWDGRGDPIDYWRGTERDGERYYAEQLIWYDRALRRDPYVKAWFLYTLGHSPAWADYDINGTRVTRHLLDYMERSIDEKDPISPLPQPVPEPEPIPTGDTMNLNDFNTLDLADTYAWDSGNPGLPANQQGNTINVPKGLDFNYVWNPDIRVTWTDRKVGSPTFGQQRRQPDPGNIKPECVTMNPLQASDVRAGSPYTGNLIKCFKGWGAIWTAYFAAVSGLVVGGKYHLLWPIFPDLVMEYLDGNKVFADDPDAGFMRLRSLPGNVEVSLGQNPDSSWYDGGDFAPGRWKVLEILFDATDTTMTVALELISTFGLENSCFFTASPTLELISTPDQPPTQPMEGTVMDSVRQIAAANAAMQTGMQTLKAAVTKFQQMMGN